MRRDYLLPLQRRSYQRFNIEASATLIFNKDLEQPSILKDLSARGAGVVSNWPLNVNTDVEIIIKSSFFFKDSVYRKAKVIWCNKIDRNLWQAGLDFGLDNKIDFEG